MLLSTAMLHRHIESANGYSSAAIDDIIGRGGMDDWREMDLAARADGFIVSRILKVCAAHTDDPYEQRYFFWRNHVERAFV